MTTRRHRRSGTAKPRMIPIDSVAARDEGEEAALDRMWARYEAEAVAASGARPIDVPDESPGETPAAPQQPPIPRVPTPASSNVASIGYDALARVLEVAYRHGGVYRYDGVPPEEWAALLDSPSVGRFLAARIKRAYPWRKVEW